MDFWEGFFVGKVWIDSDASKSSIRGLLSILSIVLALGVLFFAVFPAQQDKWFFMPIYVSLVIGLLLLVGLPFAGSVYTRQPLGLKILILAAYALQYIMWMVFFVQRIATLTRLDLLLTPEALIDFANNRINDASQFFRFLGGLAGTLAGVVAGALLVALTALVVLILVLILPYLYLLLLRAVQRGIDRLVERYFVGKKRQDSNAALPSSQNI